MTVRVYSTPQRAPRVPRSGAGRPQTAAGHPSGRRRKRRLAASRPASAGTGRSVMTRWQARPDRAARHGLAPATRDTPQLGASHCRPAQAPAISRAGTESDVAQGENGSGARRPATWTVFSPSGRIRTRPRPRTPPPQANAPSIGRSGQRPTATRLPTEPGSATASQPGAKAQGLRGQRRVLGALATGMWYIDGINACP